MPIRSVVAGFFLPNLNVGDQAFSPTSVQFSKKRSIVFERQRSIEPHGKKYTKHLFFFVFFLSLTNIFVFDVIPMKLNSRSSLFSLVVVLLVISQNKAFTQADAEVFTAKNAVFVELLGNSAGYGLNYGRIFHQKNRMKISGSVGFSALYQKPVEFVHSSYWIPAFASEVTAFFGKSRHHLEYGAGFFTFQDRDFIFDTSVPGNHREEAYWDATINARIGYRYQKPEGGFFFRAGYTPMVSFFNSKNAEKPVDFFPFGVGISLGVSF